MLDDLFDRLREWFSGLFPGKHDEPYDENAVIRRRPKRGVRMRTSVRSRYDSDSVYRRKRRRHRRRSLPPIAYTLIRILLFCVFLYCAVSLLRYGYDFIQSKLASRSLREAYYAQEQYTPEPTPTLPPEATPLPAGTPALYLRRMSYPGNPFVRVRSRFDQLQRANSDIVGWLTIEDLLDEAVVKRDNEYYLRRDYRGYHNTNGAIFMEETTDLSSRPYMIALYGHNMKTGAMFGCLRNFEDVTFLRANPFITFDSLYEDGRYVIFAVGTYGVNNSVGRYLSFGQLASDEIAARETAINALLRYSIYNAAVDIDPDDQILLLVTCVDDDTERRIVAARRLRDGETEEDAMRAVSAFRKK